MLIFLLYVAIIFFTGMQSVLTKLYNRKYSAPFSFSFIRSSSACISMAILSVSLGFTFHLPTLFWGVLYGIAFCASMYCGYMALKTGPLSLTSPIAAMSVVIPSAYSLVFLNDPFTLFKIFGFLALGVSIVFFNLPAKANNSKTDTMENAIENKPKQKINFAWALYIGTTFLCNGIASIIQIEYQNQYTQTYPNEFMVFAMLTCVFIFAGIVLIKDRFQSVKNDKGILYSIFTGLATGIVSLLTLILVPMENASVMFPIISVGTLVMSMLSGIFVFKEKQSLPRILGFIFGAAAVVLFKL